MSMYDLCNELYEERCSQLESANEHLLGLYAQGIMIKDDLRRRRFDEWYKCTCSFAQDAEERCKEKGIPFDHKTALAFIKDHRNLLCGHIGLKLVPYSIKYVPREIA